MLLIVDADVRRDLGEAIRRRFGADYRVERAGDPQSGLATLRETAFGGVAVVIADSGCCMAEEVGQEAWLGLLEGTARASHRREARAMPFSSLENDTGDRAPMPSPLPLVRVSHEPILAVAQQIQTCLENGRL